MRKTSRKIVFKRTADEMEEIQQVIEQGKEETGLDLEAVVVSGETATTFKNTRGGSMRRVGESDYYPVVKVTERRITNNHGVKFKVNEWPITVSFHERK